MGVNFEYAYLKGKISERNDKKPCRLSLSLFRKKILMPEPTFADYFNS